MFFPRFAVDSLYHPPQGKMLIPSKDGIKMSKRFHKTERGKKATRRSGERAAASGRPKDGNSVGITFF